MCIFLLIDQQKCILYLSEIHNNKTNGETCVFLLANVWTETNEIYSVYSYMLPSSFL